MSMLSLALPVLRAVTAVTTRTHCPYCAFQCGMAVTSDTEGAVPLEVKPDEDFPVNRGQMCIKGFTSAEQRRTAEAIKARVAASGFWKKPHVTQIADAGPVTAAESFHQKYLERNPAGYTCHYLRE